MVVGGTHLLVNVYPSAYPLAEVNKTTKSRAHAKGKTYSYIFNPVTVSTPAYRITTEQLP